MTTVDFGPKPCFIGPRQLARQKVNIHKPISKFTLYILSLQRFKFFLYVRIIVAGEHLQLKVAHSKKDIILAQTSKKKVPNQREDAQGSGLAPLLETSAKVKNFLKISHL